jgi:hypothetical protein
MWPEATCSEEDAAVMPSSCSCSSGTISGDVGENPHASSCIRYMRPSATSVCGLKLLGYEAFSYYVGENPHVSSEWVVSGVCGLELLLYAALSY